MDIELTTLAAIALVLAIICMAVWFFQHVIRR